MLDDLRDLLSEDGLLEPDQDMIANVFLLRSTVCEVLVPGGRDFFVKVAPRDALAQEFSASRTAHDAFPRITPRPIKLRSADDRDYLLLEKIDHDPVTRSGIERLPEEAWFDFTMLMLNGCADAEPQDHAEALSRALRLLPDDETARAMERWLNREGAPLLARLPAVIQHGDLAVNNVGLKDLGLVVFDWEDYGRVTFPLFDFTIFVASLRRFNARDIIYLHLSEPRDRIGRLARAVREKYRIDAAQQLRLAACALVLFHEIKVEGGYSTEIIETVRRTLADIWDFVTVTETQALPAMGLR